jgi:glutaredoxin
MKITVYTKSDCPSCNNLKTYLKSHNYQFEELVLNVDLSREQLLELFPGVTSVPQVLVDGVSTGGYSSTVQFLTESRK